MKPSQTLESTEANMFRSTMCIVIVFVEACFVSCSVLGLFSLAATQVRESSAIVKAAAGDSPWWPPRTSDADVAEVPTEWGEDKNVAWKVDVPGRGHASPCIVGDQIFISTAIEETEQIRLISFDRQSGAERWNQLVHEGGFMHTHDKNSHASGTPACDGSRLFVAHMLSQDGVDGVYLTAISVDGEILWQKLAGPFISQHGYAPSPVLYGESVIVVGDSEHEESFVAAFNRASGAEVWRTHRGMGRNFGSPTVAHVAGRDQLIIPGCGSTVSYDPSNGKELWHVEGPSSAAANTVAADDAKVYSSGGWPEKNLLAIRADGGGDVTESHISWRHSKAVCYVPTMLVHAGMLFTVSDDGVASCYDATSGEPLWVKRLGGAFSASPVLVGDKIYIPDEAGKMFIFQAAAEYIPIAENDLADGGFATPVVLRGKIYLRTLHRLYCISE
jgi:outer membrane protein assembly factor BamB